MPFLSTFTVRGADSGLHANVRQAKRDVLRYRLMERFASGDCASSSPGVSLTKLGQPVPCILISNDYRARHRLTHCHQDLVTLAVIWQIEAEWPLGDAGTIHRR